MSDTYSKPDIEPFDERFDVRRHPIRGFFWGLLAGLGLAIVLIILKVISLSIVAVAVTVGIVVVLAVLWGVFGPPKAPSGPVPVTVVGGAAPPPTRFDDFDAPTAADPTDPHRPAATTDPETGPVAGDIGEPGEASDDESR